MNIILMGLPGAGKGTQAQKITEEHNLIHISTGDMFREAMSKGTELGVVAKDYIDRGDLVPDEVTNGIVKERLDRSDVRKQGFMLDGFPRTLSQAEALDQIIQELNLPLDKVINIEVDPEVLVDRLSGRYICSNCGATYHKIYNPTKVEGVCDVCQGHDFFQRKDDAPDTVRNRLEVNIKSNTPLIDYYQKHGKLVNINGDQSVDKVFEDIKKALS